MILYTIGVILSSIIYTFFGLKEYRKKHKKVSWTVYASVITLCLTSWLGVGAALGAIVAEWDSDTSENNSDN